MTVSVRQESFGAVKKKKTEAGALSERERVYWDRVGSLVGARLSGGLADVVGRLIFLFEFILEEHTTERVFEVAAPLRLRGGTRSAWVAVCC